MAEYYSNLKSNLLLNFQIIQSLISFMQDLFPIFEKMKVPVKVKPKDAVQLFLLKSQTKLFLEYWNGLLAS